MLDNKLTSNKKNYSLVIVLYLSSQISRYYNFITHCYRWELLVNNKLHTFSYKTLKSFSLRILLMFPLVQTFSTVSIGSFPALTPLSFTVKLLGLTSGFNVPWQYLCPRNNNTFYLSVLFWYIFLAARLL